MTTNQTNLITSKNKLGELEAASGLKTTGTTPNLTDFYCHGDKNHYAANLDMLVNGQNSIGTTWSIAVPYNPYIISGGPNGTYVNFVKWLKENHFLSSCQQLTPAGQRGELVTGGQMGINSRATGRMPMNPMSGAGQHVPCLGADLLNSIDPNMVTNIENVCNAIITKSYLSLPASAFGSLQTLLYKAQGAVQGFVQAIYNIYHGVILLMQRFAAMINGLLSSLNQFIYNFIASIIPLDLICAILGAFQSLLDDVAFFAQLFDGGDGMFNAINSIQTVVNYASEGLSFAYNPISILSIIPGVNNLYAEFQQLTSDPEALLGNMIAHFNLSIGSNNKALQIANAILLHYGLESQLGPLGPILLSAGVSGNNSQWYRTGNTGTGAFGNYAGTTILANPGYVDPDNPFSFLDINSNPYFNAAKVNLAQFSNTATEIPGAVAAVIANPLG
jgi:hypothetical protein